MPLPPKVPAYCRHSSSGRAFCKVGGKFVYLGPHGSPESHAEYARLVEAILAGRAYVAPAAAPTGSALTVRELADRYLDHAAVYYTKNGEPTNELALLTTACGRAVEVFGDLPAAEFGSLCLETVRDRLIEHDLSRTFINASISRIRRMFRWGGAKELVPESVPNSLALVDGLRAGRTTARETPPVMPVADDVVEATLAQLPAVVADMVRLQRLTGMRPGEVRTLRPCDVDRSEDVWTYRPESHKTQHHGRERVIHLGPKAQAVLLRYLARDGATYCFRPCDSEEKRRAEQHAERITPLSCGNRPGTNTKRLPLRTAGVCYSKDTYGRAIERACKRAGVQHWSPNQLRHTAATAVRRDHGLEAAQVILGHSAANVTQVYAERDLKKGAAVAREIG